MLLKVNGLETYDGFYVSILMDTHSSGNREEAVWLKFGPIYQSENHLLESFIKMVDSAIKLDKPLTSVAGGQDWFTGNPSIRSFDKVCKRLALDTAFKNLSIRKSAVPLDYKVTYKCSDNELNVIVSDLAYKGLTVEFE